MRPEHYKSTAVPDNINKRFISLNKIKLSQVKCVHTKKLFLHNLIFRIMGMVFNIDVLL